VGRIIQIAVAVAVAAVAGAQGAGAAALEESWGNIEGAWRFSTDPNEVGEAEGWFAIEYDDSAWRALDAPGCWEAQGVTDPRPDCPPKPKDGMPWSDYDGVAWYRLRVTVPAVWRGAALELLLGSVDDEDRTYVNGRLIGETGPGIERAVSVRRRYTVPADCVQAGGANVIAIRVKDGGGPGGLMGPTLTWLPKERMDVMTTFTAPDGPLTERLTVPPAKSRILKIVHGLPDAPEDQDVLFASLLGQGFGGIVTNVSFGEYLESDEKWAAFVRGVHEAKAAGMALWLYDERGYPSGNAGGITMRDHPEWEARGLFIADTSSEGGAVDIELPPGDLVFASAFPVADGLIDLEHVTDLAALVVDGRLRWEAPAGAWRVMAVTEGPLYEGTHAAVSLADKLPYINLLMPEPTARFIEVTHGGYAQHLGDDLGQWFEATFMDEPSLMSLFMRGQAYRVLPWAPEFAAEFKTRRGYALEPVLAALVADAGAQGASVRYDFWLTVAELISENFFGQIQTWCRAHGVPSGGHLLLEEPLLTHVPLYGDFFRCARRLDAPSIDCLTSLPDQVPWFIARLISSVAELECRAVTMSETSDHVQRYRPAGDTRPVREVSEAEIRGTCNRLILNGITTITSYYSFGGLSTSQVVRLNEWVGRCCTALEGGHQVTDIAFVYPIESLWPRFVPSRNWTDDCPADARRIESAYRGVANDLFASARDFTYVDSKALIDAEPCEGTLMHGDLRWRLVVLPCVDTLPLEAWENLARFWRSGGAVIAVGTLPANSEREFPCARVQELAREVFGEVGTTPHVTTNEAGGAGVYLPGGSEALVPIVLDAILERDVRVAEAVGPIRATHRRIDGREVYFVINDGAEPWSGQLALTAEGPGEQWNPASGTMTPVASAEAVDLDLDPYGGALFVFEQARMPRRLQVEEGTLPGLRISPLPVAEPSVSKGEFVQGDLTACEARPEWAGMDMGENSGASKAWRAEATLTKGEVDTFLFVSFDYAQTLDLSDAACVVVTAWMPEQTAATRLLVILRDAKGVDYIASTEAMLNTAGPVQCLIPRRRFERAGWSHNAEGALDFAAVSAVRVGWGGYLGAEGQHIDFTLAPPAVAKK